LNLTRLRGLVKAGKDGTIQPEELKELFEALPLVLADAEAWRKGMALLDELRERVIPCGHKIEDLIGGEGHVTKCGACLMALRNVRPKGPPALPRP
jgi:hypothetical protein